MRKFTCCRLVYHFGMGGTPMKPQREAAQAATACLQALCGLMAELGTAQAAPPIYTLHIIKASILQKWISL